MLETILSLCCIFLFIWGVAGILWFTFHCDENCVLLYNYKQKIALYFVGGPIVWFIMLPLNCANNFIEWLGEND